MPPSEGYTVSIVSALLDISTSTIYRWVAKGKLDAVNTDSIIVIPHTDKNSQVISAGLEKKWSRASNTAYTPIEISDFSKWHEVLDQIAWLFKVCYSHKDDLKRKKFRLDLIFQNYLSLHKVTLKKVRQVFASNNLPRNKIIIDDLKRGWYNELAYLVPLKRSTLGLSFSDITLNAGISSQRFAFPSWKITTAYYSAYFFLRSLTFQKVNELRIEEHKATVTTFKNCVLKPLERVIWKFPLDISYAPKVRVYRDDLLVNKL